MKIKGNDALIKLDTATRMLAEAKDLSEIKKVRDISQAAMTYAKVAKLGLAAYNHAAVFKLRAERKAGEFLKQLERGIPKPYSNMECGSQYHSVLEKNNIPETTAWRWQQLLDMPEDEFEGYLSETLTERPITTSWILNKIRKDQNAAKPIKPLPEGTFRVFYADPPWQYNSGDQHGEKEQDTILGTYYNSMSIAEISALPIKEKAQDDAVLFLWVTSPLLAESFDVINAWGFNYKASMIWNKDAHNVGHYVSVRHEFLLICTRGSCLPDNKKLYPSVITEKRTDHSVKPEIFRNIIDDLYPEGNRIELFARRAVDGWDAWGNEPEVL